MTLRRFIALLGLVIILFAVNYSIVGKERHLDEGRTVYLELAPVDPRSLMQGDYMALRFKVANELGKALPKPEGGGGWWRKVEATDGWAVLEIDENGVGRFAGVADQPGSTAARLNVAYRVRSGTVKFATNAFFFQEGTAELFERARYGEFRVNEQGEPLLVAMLDQNLQILDARAAKAP